MFWFYPNFHFVFPFLIYYTKKISLLFNPNTKKKIYIQENEITEECISRPFGQPLCLVAEESLAETPPRKGIRKKNRIQYII